MHISPVAQSYAAMQVPAPVATNPASTWAAPAAKPIPAAVPQVAAAPGATLAMPQGVAASTLPRASGDGSGATGTAALNDNNTSSAVAQDSNSVDFLA
jgi:hypothetical protein